LTLCAADRDYHFTTKQQLLSDVRSKKFLEVARVNVHSHPCTSSAAAAAAAPPQPLSYWYGTSLATVREVAATGKLCIMSLDVQGAQVRWCFWHMLSMQRVARSGDQVPGLCHNQA
jgi:guanylate kinase